jgi:L-propargylglycine--L-glutamate ligase
VDTDVGSTRIVLYSPSYAGRVLEAIPYTRYLWERSLCYLSDLRQDHTHLIMITPAPVDSHTLDYHFRDLYQFDDQQVRSATERLTFLTPRPTPSRPLDAAVLADDEIMYRLVQEMKLGRNVSITNFAASPEATKIASVLGSGLDEPDPQLSARWGSKLGGKQILLRSSVAVPPGDPRLLTDEASVTAAARRLTTTGDRSARQVVVKLDDSSWGSAIGNAVLDGERLLRTGDLRESVELIHQPWTDFIQELSRGGAIVEEYLPDVTSSPSGIGQIAGNGAVTVTATHDQTLSLGEYMGARFPCGEQWRQQIIHSVERVGHTLSDLGVRGTFGVDFVASATRGLHAVEINLRKVGPSHAVHYVESVAGPLTDRHSRPGQDERPLHYLYRRVLQPDILHRLHPRVIIDRLRNADLLYQHTTGEGVILHMLGALPSCGFIELTSIATSHAAASAIDESALAVAMRDL